MELASTIINTFNFLKTNKVNMDPVKIQQDVPNLL